MRDLGNVDQAFHFWEDLGKRAEGGHADDLDGDHAAHGIISAQDLPGVVLELLVAERDLLFLGIKALDVYVNHVPDVHNVGRMFDALPRKLRAVDHAVHAGGDLHKRTVVGQALHGAGVMLAFLGLRPELLTGFSAKASVRLADGTDGPAATAVDVDNDKLHGLVQHILQSAVARHGGKRSRNKYADAVYKHDETFADDFNNRSLKDPSFVMGFHDRIPILDRVVTALGQHDGALYVVRLHDDQVQLVSDFQFRGGICCGVGAVLVQRDITGLFSADIHLDLVGCNVHNRSNDLLVVAHAAEAFLQRLFKGHFLRVRNNLGLSFGFGCCSDCF